MTNAEHLQGLLEAALRAESAGLYVSKPPANARGYACSVQDCPNPAYAKGLCNAHYLRARKGRSMDVPLKHRTGGTCRECDRPVDNKGGWALCKSHFNIRRRALLKSVCIKAMGGKCAHCRGVFHPAAYDFHHVDPSQKELAPSDMVGNRSIATLAREVSKCILLCANCHRIEHARE